MSIVNKKKKPTLFPICSLVRQKHKEQKNLLKIHYIIEIHKRLYRFLIAKLRKTILILLAKAKGFSLYICVSSSFCALFCAINSRFLDIRYYSRNNIKVNGHYILWVANVHKYYNSGKQENKFILEHERVYLALLYIFAYNLHITKFNCR